MKKLLALLLAFAMVFTLCACGAKEEPKADAPAEEAPAVEEVKEPIVIKLTTTNGSNNHEVKQMIEHCEIIKERTGGMVDIQVYPDGQMLVYAEGIEAVMSSSNVIYYTACNLFSDYVPEFTTVYLPYLYENLEIADAFFKSDLWAEIVDKANDAGLHVICNNGFNGYRSICANKPVYTAADVEGLSIRIPDSTLYIETFKALKANYMAGPWSEVYSNMQAGIIDGFEGTNKSPVSASAWEMPHQMYFSLTQHILDNAGFFVGYDFWMSIPEEYRAIIEEEFYTALAEGNELTNADLDGYLEEAKANGIEVIEITDFSTFQEAVKPVIEASPMGSEVLAEIAEIKAALGY